MRNKPRIRFKGFTEDWEQRKLGECMDSFEYGLNAAAKEYDGMHKYIRITDIDDETHNFIQSNLTSPDIDFNSDVSDYKLNINDIVFARTGASVGKTYLYNPSDGDLYYAGFLIRGKVNEACDAGFIYQNTLTRDYDSFIRITSQRSGQPGVNSKEYTTFRLNIPCKDEQEKISELLNRLDKLFTLHQRKLEKLKLAKKALLQKLFPKNGSQFPEIRFKGFTDAWEQRKLSDISTKVTTKNVDVHYTETLTNSAEQGIISQVDFFDKEISNKDNINGYYIVDNNDFIYNPRISTLAPVGPINRNKLNRTGIMSPLYTVFRSSNVDLGFLEWYFQSSHWHRYMKLNGDSGARADRIAIKDSTFFEMTIKIPVNIKEQVLIGETLEKFNQYITLHQRKLERLQEVKKGLLQKMFV